METLFKKYEFWEGGIKCGGCLEWYDHANYTRKAGMAVQVICLLALRYRPLFISISRRADPCKLHSHRLLARFDQWEEMIGEWKVGEAKLFLSFLSLSSTLFSSPLLLYSFSFERYFQQ